MRTKTTQVLLVEDDRDHADLVQLRLQNLRDWQVQCHWVQTLSEGVERVKKGDIDAVLLDLRLPDSDINETLRRMLRASVDAPIIVLTSLNDTELALQAVHQGAQDYLDKSHLSPELLARSIHYAIERKRYGAELERSNRELQQFAHIVSHELKSPLSAVTYFCEILLRKYGGMFDSDMIDFIRKTKQAVHGMADLVNELLKYASVNGVRNIENVETQKAVEEAIANLQPLVAETNARITHDRLPPVMANGTQLRQLFQNLFDNALKYRSQQPPSVHIHADRDGDTWRFAVRDNGIGIEACYQDRIFSIFERVPTVEQPTGTGIGLAFCKRIVEQHGGRIWVESQPAQGSTFYFTLPAAS